MKILLLIEKFSRTRSSQYEGFSRRREMQEKYRRVHLELSYCTIVVDFFFFVVLDTLFEIYLEFYKIYLEFYKKIIIFIKILF